MQTEGVYDLELVGAQLEMVSDIHKALVSMAKSDRDIVILYLDVKTGCVTQCPPVLDDGAGTVLERVWTGEYAL